MKNMILGEVIKPLASRVGTMLAAFLVATTGAETSMAQDVSTGVVAMMLICVDLCIRKVIQRGNA